MNKEEKIKELQETYNNLLPKAKAWDRDRLLLSWGFMTAILITVVIEFSKYITNNLILIPFNLKITSEFYVLFPFLLFGLWGTVYIGKIIDTNANDSNRVLDVLKKTIDSLKAQI